MTYCLMIEFFVEGMDMPTNIPEASTNQMAPTTQYALAVVIASFISTAPGIPMASAIPEDIQVDSAISAQSSTILVGSAIPDVIPVHLNISVHSAITVQPGIQEASVVPPPVSPYFTPAAPTVLTPTTPIPTPVPG
jgi:hypothetical protein